MGRKGGVPSHGIVGPSPLSSSTPSPLTPAVVRALAWDPTGTASLAIFKLPPAPGREATTTTIASATTTTIDLDVFLSHDGTGCSTSETECLLRCLDARGRRRRERKTTTTDDDSTRRLSKDYRAALRGCLRRLEEEGEQSSEKEGGTRSSEREGGDDGVVVIADSGPSSSPPDVVVADGALESLRLIHAITHLAEIFLLPLSSSSSGGGRRLDGPAGSMTADAVRYLRLHHGRGRGRSSPLDAPWVRTMLDDDQPEYYVFPSDDRRRPPSNSCDDYGSFGSPYWDLLLRCVVRGELVHAWTLLSHHSACRRAEEAEADAMVVDVGEGGTMMMSETSPEAEGFAALRAILLSAPIPGGRGGDDDEDDDEGEEEDENEGGGERWDDFDNIPLVEGVPPGADLLWEAFPRRARRLRSIRGRRRSADIDGDGRQSESLSSSLSFPILPELYQPHVAMSTFRCWQETIRNIAFPSGVGGDSSSVAGVGGILSVLFKRFPPLRQIVSILVGSTPPSIAEPSSLEWSDALLMELLYSRPNIMPEDIATRARVAMSKRSVGQGSQNDTLDEIVVAIMNGNAGQVVETMFSMCGGSSGAALPATMTSQQMALVVAASTVTNPLVFLLVRVDASKTSLLCNLLVDAGCLSQPHDLSPSKFNIQTELHLIAAEAIVSSFSVQGQCNIGVRMAVDFLLPYSLPKRVESVTTGITLTTNCEIDYEPRIAAMIAHVLSHRSPDTDSEARDLLQLCEEAVRLGSVPIADACETLAFSRAIHYRANGIHSCEVYWFLRGMEVLSLWLPPDRRRRLGFASRRHFDVLCERSANALISVFSSAAVANLSNAGISEAKEKEMSKALRVAEDVLGGILQDDVMAPVLQGLVEASLLKYSVDIALADANGETVQVATGIVHCLEERCLSEDDGQVVSTLADPRMYSDLLHIAFAILVKEDEVSEGQPMEFAKCAFTIHGMHILMARLTQVLAWEGVICVSNESSPSQPKQPSDARKEHFRTMRLAFCKGLMRAITNEQPRKSSTTKNGSEVSLEEEMELMLSPCI
ncbi:hypothetical protein ACHAXA_005479 [Cyclostephanos tholiformis]|uniref:Nuclear pore complex protein Nup85 n=1 Tax=Cyclostephanos tholiformis TaxID=382380 RepID=A0ABD3SHW2_9STRA